MYTTLVNGAGTQADTHENKYPRLVQNDGEERLMTTLSDRGIFSENATINIEVDETNTVYAIVDMHLDSRDVSTHIAGIKSKLRDCSVHLSDKVLMPVLDVVSIKIQHNSWDGGINAKLLVDGTSLL